MTLATPLETHFQQLKEINSTIASTISVEFALGDQKLKF